MILERYQISDKRKKSIIEKIIHCFELLWPKTRKTRTGAISIQLSELALSQIDDFVRLVDAVHPHMVQADTYIPILKFPTVDLMKRKGLLPHFLKLFDALLPDNTKNWPHDFPQMLNKITINDPSMKNNAHYLNIEKRMHMKNCRE